MSGKNSAKLEAETGFKYSLSDTCNSIRILDLLFLCIFKLQKLLLPVKFF